MNACVALLDSNVIVAALAPAHQHHAASAALLDAALPTDYAVAAHSHAEAYVTLTRTRIDGALGFTPPEAARALVSIRATTVLIGLAPAQTLEMIDAYAEGGGVGARLYDALIGHVAVVHRIPAIITWNRRHMAGLFPQLRVATPAEF